MLLDLEEWPDLNINHAADIDKAVDFISQKLSEAFKIATPKTYINGYHKKEKWWSENLREMRRNLRTLKKD